MRWWNRRPAAAGESSADIRYGGQAVIDGVMMRGRRAMAVAVRHPSGEVIVHAEALNSLFHRSRWAQQPFLRGMFLLWHSLTLGMRALVYSVNIALDQRPAPGQETPPLRPPPAPAAATAGEATPPPRPTDPHPQRLTPISQPAARKAFGGGLMWGTLATALVLTIGLFFVLPVLVASLLEAWLPAIVPSVVPATLVEGVVRLCLLLLYLWLIGYVPGIQRTFAYHGAEHKAINAFEAGEPLRVDRVLPYGAAHPRCGTAFVLYVMLVSALVFALIDLPSLSLPERIVSRVVLVPVVASLAYEVIRFGGQRRHGRVTRALLAPGLALQALTTREPDAAQVEVAIAALERVVAIDRSDQPDGAADTHL